MFQINKQIADKLRYLAFLYESTGEKRKSMAFNKAANNVELYETPVDSLTDPTEIPYVGASTSNEIAELLSRGTTARIDSLKAKVNIPDLSNLCRLPGIGEVGAKKLWNKYGFTTIEGMKKAIELERLVDPALIEKVEFVERNSEYASRIVCEEAGNRVIELLKPFAITEDYIALAGSIRRKKDLVRDIDIVLATNHSVSEISTLLIETGYKIKYGGDVKLRIEYLIGDTIRGGDIILTNEKSWPFALLYLTGSVEFNIVMRDKARQHGYSLNQYSFEPATTVEFKTEFKTEEDIFKFIDLPYIPPECRTGRSLQSFDHILNTKPSGDLHTHTTMSDGHLYITELVKEAKEYGYKFFGISDHTTAIPKGVAKEEIPKYIEVIKENSELFGIPVYAGLEVEVNVNKDLVYEYESLKNLDYIILAIHHSIGTNMVDRYLSGIEQLKGHPTIIAHLTGRSFGNREVPDEDWEKLFKVCAEKSIVIEINCQPDRLDPPDELIRLAKSHGCKFILSSDTHTGICEDLIENGYYKARVSELTNDDLILNKKDLYEFFTSTE